MALLFVGSENDCYKLIGHHIQGSSVTSFFRGTASPDIDTNFSQNGVGPYNNAHMQIDIPAQTELWVHFLVNLQVNGSTALNPLVRLCDSTSGTWPGQVVVQLDPDVGVAPYNATTGFDLEYWDGAAFQVAPGRGADRRSLRLAVDCRQKIDIHVKIDNVAGWFRVYIDGVLRQEFTGDTLNTGFTQVDRILLRGNADESGGSTSAAVFTEVIVSQEDTRNLRIANLEPTANGTTGDWDGDITDVDDDALRDTEFIATTVANEVETYTTSDLSATADNLEIKAVVTNARAKRGNLGTGPQNLQHAIRRSGVDYFSANVTHPAGATFGMQTLPTQAIWLTDPSTSAAWTAAGVNAMEIGVKAIT